MRYSDSDRNDRGQLLGDTAAVIALLDRLLHHAHVLKINATIGFEVIAHLLRAEGLHFELSLKG